MQFFLRGVAVDGSQVLPDDLVSDMALKLTKGLGGVYLYGKQKGHFTSSAWYTKYGRPLAKQEVVAELRNMGSPLKVGKPVYDEAELQTWNVQSGFRYIPLGQLLPIGIQTIPPSNVVAVHCSGDRRQEARLFQYPNLTDIFAVDVPPNLQGVYLLQPPGTLPADAALRTTVLGSSPPSFIVRAAVRLAPVCKGFDQADLLRVFRTLHASADVPYIWLNDPPLQRKFVDAPFSAQNPNRGLSVQFDATTTLHLLLSGATEIVFEGSVGVEQFEAELRHRVNPFLWLINRAMQTRLGPSETDLIAVRTRVDLEEEGYDLRFPAFRSLEASAVVRLSVQYRFPPCTMLPMQLPAEWGGVFSLSSERRRYLRCPAPHPLIIQHTPEATDVTLGYLGGLTHAYHAGLHLTLLTQTESCLGEEPTAPATTEAAEFFLEEEAPARLTICSPLERAEQYGFMLNNVVNDGAVFTLEAQTCFLPVRYFRRPTEPLRWCPTLTGKETRGFLNRAAPFFHECEPTWDVFSKDGFVVGVNTVGGTVVRCLRSKSDDAFARFREAVREAIPPERRHEVWERAQDKSWLRPFVKEIMQDKIAFVDCPNYPSLPYYIKHVLLLPMEHKTRYIEAIVDEIARRPHLRCHILHMNVVRDYVLLDQAPDEEIS